MTTTQRMSIHDVDPNAYKAVLGLQKYVNSGSLGAALTAIVDIRASQINHCAWCLDMHTAEAREAGVPQRKQAVLALTEQVTLIADGVSDAVWQRVSEEFDEQEIVELIMTISVINVWNRMNVTARTALPDRPAGQ